MTMTLEWVAGARGRHSAGSGQHPRGRVAVGHLRLRPRLVRVLGRARGLRACGVVGWLVLARSWRTFQSWGRPLPAGVAAAVDGAATRGAGL